MSSALLVVDPYNDFVSRRGKGWPLAREVAKSVGLLDNLQRAIAAARESGMPVAYAPHYRYRRHDPAVYEHPTPNQRMARLAQFFADNGYGGKFHRDLAPLAGDFIATEHHVSSAFGGSDLDAHLRGAGIDSIVVCGLLTNTCIESTVRQGVDLGYHVTVLTDAVAAWTPTDHAAALEGSLRHVAHRLQMTADFTP